MEDNFRPPSRPEGSTYAPSDRTDLSTPDRTESAGVSVTNEEMSDHVRSKNDSGTPSQSENMSAGRTSLDQPGERYLPALELDFGSEVAEADQALQKRPENPEKAPSDYVPPSNEAQGRRGENSDDIASPDDQPEKQTDRPTNKRPLVELTTVANETQESRAEQPEGTTEPATSRENLSRLASETYARDPEALSQFDTNLETFEKRSATAELTDRDKQEFYGQIERVLNESKTGNDLYSSKDLKQIASDLMLHAAKPGTVNQGTASTCTTAALETILYTQEPATVARLVSDVALTGKYTTADGSTVSVPEKNLHPDKYKADTPPEKARSLASHIAQPQMINIHWNQKDEFQGESGKRGRITYEEGYPTEFPGDSHSRLIDNSKSPPQSFTEKHSTHDPTVDIAAYGEEDRPVEGPYMHMEDMPGIYKQLRGNKNDLTVVNNKEAPGVTKPESAEAFKEILNDAHDRKKPVLLGVHANRDPFLSDLNESYSGQPLTEEQRKEQAGKHAHHALVALDMDPATGLVTIENQWGNKVDHTGIEGQKAKLPVDTVYDTIHDRALDPDAKPTEIKKPTPDQYVKGQKSFVEQLEKDKDVDPQVMFKERSTLHKYLSHWGHKDEAHKQAEILSSDLSNRLNADKGDKNLFSDLQSYMYGMSSAGETELSKGMLKELDQRFERKTPSADGSYLREFKDVLKMHRIDGNENTASQLANSVVSKLNNEHGRPGDIKNRKSIQVLTSLHQILTENGLKEPASRVSENMLNNVRAYERAHGSDNVPVADGKTAVMYLNNLDAQETKTLAAELQQSYDRVSEKGDLDSDLSLGLRHSLSNFYEHTRDPKALNAIVQDDLKYQSNMTDPKGNYAMIEAYKDKASQLYHAGGADLAVPLMEQAVKLAQAKAPSQVPNLGDGLVRYLDRAGRSEEGDRVAKELGIQVRFRRRGDMK